jgi:molybdenum-dependent DNA-binding transcriptional regulator ModE
MAKGGERTGPELALFAALGGRVAIGLVHASLLTGIRDTGSIAAAQRRLGAMFGTWSLR